jgi:hypothetical protein
MEECEAGKSGYYAIAYYDILGQSNLLDSISNNPSSEVHFKTMTNRLIEIASPIFNLRDDLKTFFDRLTMTSLVTCPPLGQNEDHLAAIKDYESSQIGFQAFSDTVVVYAPIVTQSGKISILPLSRFLLASMYAFLCSLARGYAIRGAIDVGFGIGFPTEFYGPALLSVYNMESSCANWPRILIGEGVIDLCNELANPGSPRWHDGANSRIISNVMKFIFTDTDGRIALDYLSESLINNKDFMGWPLKGIALEAYQQALRLNMVYSENEKIKLKYRNLITYFEAQLDFKI